MNLFAARFALSRPEVYGNDEITATLLNRLPVDKIVQLGRAEFLKKVLPLLTDPPAW